VTISSNSRSLPCKPSLRPWMVSAKMEWPTLGIKAATMRDAPLANCPACRLGT